MSRPFTPSTFICTECGWKRTRIPKGADLRLGSDWFYFCPRCKSTELKARNATKMEVLGAKLCSLFRHPLG